MGFASAWRKVHESGKKPVDELHATWKRPRRRAGHRRLFRMVGLVAGLGVVIALLWLALVREDRR